MPFVSFFVQFSWHVQSYCALNNKSVCATHFVDNEIETHFVDNPIM